MNISIRFWSLLAALSISFAAFSTDLMLNSAIRNCQYQQFPVLTKKAFADLVGELFSKDKAANDETIQHWGQYLEAHHTLLEDEGKYKFLCCNDIKEIIIRLQAEELQKLQSLTTAPVATNLSVFPNSFNAGVTNQFNFVFDGAVCNQTFLRQPQGPNSAPSQIGIHIENYVPLSGRDSSTIKPPINKERKAPPKKIQRTFNFITVDSPNFSCGPKYGDDFQMYQYSARLGSRKGFSFSEQNYGDNPRASLTSTTVPQNIQPATRDPDDDFTSLADEIMRGPNDYLAENYGMNTDTHSSELERTIFIEQLFDSITAQTSATELDEKAEATGLMAKCPTFKKLDTIGKTALLSFWEQEGLREKLMLSKDPRGYLPRAFFSYLGYFQISDEQIFAIFKSIAEESRNPSKNSERYVELMTTFFYKNPGQRMTDELRYAEALKKNLITFCNLVDRSFPTLAVDFRQKIETGIKTLSLTTVPRK